MSDHCIPYFLFRKGVKLADDIIIERDHVHVWVALPYAPRCTWHCINAAKLGPRYSARLGYRQLRSRKLVLIAETRVEFALARGGSARFEWPRRFPGWRARVVRTMSVELGFFSVDFDGCFFVFLLRAANWHSNRGKLLPARQCWRMGWQDVDALVATDMECYQAQWPLLLVITLLRFAILSSAY